MRVVTWKEGLTAEVAVVVPSDHRAQVVRYGIGGPAAGIQVLDPAGHVVQYSRLGLRESDYQTPAHLTVLAR